MDAPASLTPGGVPNFGETMKGPFAAIPLDWLRSKDPYHRFLLWVIPEIAGVDGFGGLLAGQVRFSRRDVELSQAVGSTQATGFIKRAVCDGLLKPTQNYSRRKGMGEVYDTEGDLKATRLNAQTNNKPRPNQQQTNQVSECLVLDHDANQQQTKTKPTTNRLIDKTKKDQEDQGDLKKGGAVLEPYVSLWNSTLSPLGYGKCEKITPKRSAALAARLRQDPDYFATFSRAVDYLAADDWWRGKAKQFTIDLLLDQAGRAQELSEKTPSSAPKKSYNSRTAEVDELFIQQMQALGYN